MKQSTEAKNIIKIGQKIERLRWKSYIAELHSSRTINQIKQETQNLLSNIENYSRKDDAPIISSYIKKLKVDFKQDIQAIIRKFEYKKDLETKQAASDLLNLCHLRNQYAKMEGYKSYPHLALKAQGFTKAHSSYDAILTYIKKPSFKAISNYVDLDHLENYWNYYDSLLSKDLPEIVLAEDQCLSFFNQLLKHLKIEKINEKIDIVIKDQPYAGGVAFDLSNKHERQAGILIRPGKARTLFTIAHELGHALLYLLKNNNDNCGIIPPWLDESFAVLIENDYKLIKKALSFLFDDKTIEQLINNHQKLKAMEYNRIYASILTEIEIWKTIDNNDLINESQIEHITSQCTNNSINFLNTSYKDPYRWSIDSFRSIDPIYVHSYIMAENISENILRKKTINEKYEIPRIENLISVL